VVRGGAVPLIERIYAGLELDRSEWLGSIRDACLETFDESVAGAAAMEIAVKPDLALELRAMAPDAKLQELIHATLATTGSAGSTEPIQALRMLLQLAPPSVIRACYLSGPVVNVHAAMRKSGHREMHDVMRSLGVPDWAGAVGLDPSGRGVVLSWSRPSSEPMARSVRFALSRVAAHLSAAVRLRARRAAEPDAVLESDGRVAHAGGDARERDARTSLREAALSIDRARRGGSNDVERADLWRALVEGRWSLVESFDSDGRRYFVARRNDPTARENPLLDERERKVVALTALGHPLKVVAYDLGLAQSTVSSTLRTAMRKLGVQNRASLIALHGSVIGEDANASIE
jgi:DNA-binding CsgD family transcriptional regulator